MTIKTRTDLKGEFDTGKILTKTGFHDLIDSMLNKQDDYFMGRWKAGTAYRTGNVVIYNKALWEVPTDDEGNEQEICSCTPPNEGDDWVSLIVPVEDEDWFVHKNNNIPNGAMHAQHYKCIGIGRVWNSNQEPPDLPEAKLEVVQAEGIEDEEEVEKEEVAAARFLIFPKGSENPTLSLLQVGNEEGRKNAFLLFGLDNNKAHFVSDAPAGFIFRRQEHAVPGTESQLNFKDGDLLMVIKPSDAGSGTARVGISTQDPKAMLDITDRKKGQFLISPDDKDDPVFTIINLEPDAKKSFLASGVGPEWAVFISDSPKGFSFKGASDYGSFCKIPDINQGDTHLVIQASTDNHAQIGIGTETPCSMLHVTDNKKGAFIVNPERSDDPNFSLVKLTDNKNNYLAGILSAERAILVTDAPKGFEFKTGDKIIGDCPSLDSATGERLVVILQDGKVGVGTKSNDPSVRMEITDELSGRFLFNLDDKKVNPSLGIVNTRPGTDNYLTLGADNKTAVLVTDSKNGFAFKQGGPAGTNHNEVDIVQGDIYLRLMPQHFPPYPKPAEAIFFPDKKGKVGIGRKPGDFHLDLKGTMRAYNIMLDTDFTNISKEEQLSNYLKNNGYKTALDRIMKFVPLAFEWDTHATNLENEGKQYGFKAQEVLDVLPDLVKENSTDNKLSVAYNNIIAVLVQGMQEQQAIINDLKKRVAALEK